MSIFDGKLFDEAFADSEPTEGSRLKVVLPYHVRRQKGVLKNIA